MGPRGRFYPYLYDCDYIGLLVTGFMQAFYLGRAPRTKETLPDFLKWRGFMQAWGTWVKLLSVRTSPLEWFVVI